jgi:ABC-type transporter Mla subunit MlaD
MKFSQLPVGQAFRYQGTRYRKVSPLMAQAEGASRTRLIARSANVEPSDQAPPAKPLSERIPRQQVEQAMQQLAAQVTQAVSESGLTGDGANTLLRQLQQAFDACRRSLERE